jgi:hypothetical protein
MGSVVAMRRRGGEKGTRKDEKNEGRSQAERVYAHSGVCVSFHFARTRTCGALPTLSITTPLTGEKLNRRICL